MASIDDAIFLMDDEDLCDTIIKPVQSSNKKAKQIISNSLPNETISIINIAKSPPIDIIKPVKPKINQKAEFVPSSPYTV